MAPECTATVHRPTRWSYVKYRCRCPETVAVMRADRREREQLYRRRTPNLRARKRHSDYIDEIAVERACYGDVVELTVEERREAVRRLIARGLSARQVAARLGVTSRTVNRARLAIREGVNTDVGEVAA